jgi:hypothetical protein
MRSTLAMPSHSLDWDCLAYRKRVIPDYECLPRLPVTQAGGIAFQRLSGVLRFSPRLHMRATLAINYGALVVSSIVSQVVTMPLPP